MAKINWKEKQPYQAPEPTEIDYMMIAMAELDAQREIDIQGLAGNWLSDPTIEPLTGNPLLLSK